MPKALVIPFWLTFRILSHIGVHEVRVERLVVTSRKVHRLGLVHRPRGSRPGDREHERAAGFARVVGGFPFGPGGTGRFGR